MDPVRRSKVIASAGLARRLYPGPVGDMLAEELTAWCEIGYRFGERGGLIDRLVDYLDAEINRRAVEAHDKAKSAQ